MIFYKYHVPFKYYNLSIKSLQHFLWFLMIYQHAPYLYKRNSSFVNPLSKARYKKRAKNTHEDEMHYCYILHKRYFHKLYYKLIHSARRFSKDKKAVINTVLCYQCNNYQQICPKSVIHIVKNNKFCCICSILFQSLKVL